MTALEYAALSYAARNAGREVPMGRWIGGVFIPEGRDAGRPCCRGIVIDSSAPLAFLEHCKTLVHVAVLYDVDRDDLLVLLLSMAGSAGRPILALEDIRRAVESGDTVPFAPGSPLSGVCPLGGGDGPDRVEPPVDSSMARPSCPVCYGGGWQGEQRCACNPEPVSEQDAALQDLRIFWGPEICRIEYLLFLLETGRVKPEVALERA